MKQNKYNKVERTIPVSYTHLDVYKRQVCRYCTGRWSMYAICCSGGWSATTGCSLAWGK